MASGVTEGWIEWYAEANTLEGGEGGEGGSRGVSVSVGVGALTDDGCTVMETSAAWVAGIPQSGLNT